ncbi:hypothetical protein V5799_022110 [Amblyomma americanum]|uniref:Serine/threonine-protein phosphatase n=1 Tax=Amblyomma americanum TaxID=6943 RepID=A0AAQ4FLY5_AMBAM
MADQPERLNIDNVLQRLLEVRGSRPGKNVQLSENEIRGLCLKGREVFLSQPILLELEAPLKICGDTHGQYYDLLRLFEYGGFPPESNYLFLGDYVDRGRHSLETISLLLAYKIKYPENFFILRGNHECASINRIYGFYDECKRRYNIKLWKTFTDCFNCLPVAAIVDEKIFCMHGGLSPDLQSMEQVRRIMRPTDVPDQGLLCDLLWSDPDKDIMGWGENDRGVSFTFGADVVAKFLHKHDLDLICRAHQVVEDGYEFFAKRQLVTLFSAPNYCGEFDNAGAMMSVDETLMCSFQILKPADKKKFPYGGIAAGGKPPAGRGQFPNHSSSCSIALYIVCIQAGLLTRSWSASPAGSLAKVHKTCLETWLGNQAIDQCEICKYHYMTARRPKGFHEWLMNSSTREDKQNLVGDMVALLLLTPLVVFSLWLCTEGAIQFSHEGFPTWESAGLVFITIVLFVVFCVWVTLLYRYHYTIWKQWRSHNFHVNLLVKTNASMGDELPSTAHHVGEPEASPSGDMDEGLRYAPLVDSRISQENHPVSRAQPVLTRDFDVHKIDHARWRDNRTLTTAAASAF